MEQNRHHNFTFDSLDHCELGRDPANWLYTLQVGWYGWLTVRLIPLWHRFDANDIGKCDKAPVDVLLADGFIVCLVVIVFTELIPHWINLSGYLK